MSVLNHTNLPTKKDTSKPSHSKKGNFIKKNNPIVNQLWFIQDLVINDTH